MRERGAQTVAEGAEWDRICSTCSRSDFGGGRNTLLLLQGRKSGWLQFLGRFMSLVVIRWGSHSLKISIFIWNVSHGEAWQ